jgi:hypothetical protein
MNNEIHGVKVAHGAPAVSHLLFADDSLFFCRASTKEATAIKNIIEDYQEASGQLVNMAKSEMMFSKNVPPANKTNIGQIMPMSRVDHFSKYLGMPTQMGRSKKQVFNYIQDCVWKKIKGWKAQHLSFAGRSTLIKAVAQVIPTYIMSCFRLPKELCSHIERMVCRFWWGSNTDKRKIHWIKWSNCCKHKKNGGLGFREMSDFNEALLAKQGWKCITQPNSLTAQILKAKYYPHTSFQEASIGNKNVSYTWRSIKSASWVLNKGGLWTIGNGEKIDIWHDNWLPRQHGYKVWSTQGTTTQTWVKDLFVPNTKIWDRNIINRIFHHFEAEQILQIPTNGSFRQDEFTWPLTKDGNYTVKSGYQAIQDWKVGNKGPSTSDTNNNNPIWQKLWKLKIPPKHSTLLWRILHNALPVQDNLRKRGINCYPLCTRCNAKIEDQNHVFCECEWAKKVWFGSALTIRFNEKNLVFSKWIEEGLMSMTTQNMEIIGALCYHIWKARNHLIFRNNNIPATDVIHQAPQSIFEYQQHQRNDSKPSQRSPQSSRHSDSNWIPPPRASLKLNVDAHRLAGDGHWGIGLVLRREDGSCVGAATREAWGLTEAIEAEAMGLSEAIEFLKRFQHQAVIIELDNQTVVKAVKDRVYPRKY